MVSDINQNLYVNKALGEGVRPEGTLFPEESNRLRLVRKAVINLSNTVNIMTQVQEVHPSIRKIMEGNSALDHADVGVKEFEASRQLEPSVVESLLQAMESPKGMAEEARSIVEEIHGGSDLNELLTATDEQFAVSA